MERKDFVATTQLYPSEDYATSLRRTVTFTLNSCHSSSDVIHTMMAGMPGGPIGPREPARPVRPILPAKPYGKTMRQIQQTILLRIDSKSYLSLKSNLYKNTAYLFSFWSWSSRQTRTTLISLSQQDVKTPFIPIVMRVNKMAIKCQKQSRMIHLTPINSNVS